jgi:hypothetical protein
MFRKRVIGYGSCHSYDQKIAERLRQAFQITPLRESFHIFFGYFYFDPIDIDVTPIHKRIPYR